MLHGCARKRSMNMVCEVNTPWAGSGPHSHTRSSRQRGGGANESSRDKDIDLAHRVV